MSAESLPFEYRIETLIAWLTERRDNALSLAAQKTGDDRKGWEDDAYHFQWAITEVKAKSVD
jgi:hypothetical protein